MLPNHLRNCKSRFPVGFCDILLPVGKPEGSTVKADAQIQSPYVDKVPSRWSDVEEDFSTKVFILMVFMIVARTCVYLCMYSWPLNNMGAGAPNPRALENPCITLNSPKM